MNEKISHNRSDETIEATHENIRYLLDALLDSDIGTASLTHIDEILSNEITIFKDRVCIDVQIKPPDICFKDAWKRKKNMNYNNQAFHIVCIEDLIASKKAAGRSVDLEDIRLLELPDYNNNIKHIAFSRIRKAAVIMKFSIDASNMRLPREMRGLFLWGA